MCSALLGNSFLWELEILREIFLIMAILTRIFLFPYRVLSRTLPWFCHGHLKSRRSPMSLEICAPNEIYFSYISFVLLNNFAFAIAIMHHFNLLLLSIKITKLQRWTLQWWTKILTLHCTANCTKNQILDTKKSRW